MLQKLMEFNMNPTLKPIIDLSKAGKTLDFIETFNNLHSGSLYSKYKITLYDINQRAFIVQ